MMTMMTMAAAAAAANKTANAMDMMMEKYRKFSSWQ
jgi:hypothetical protein